MRNVSRHPKPVMLAKNAGKWTNSLMKVIRKSRKTGKKVPDDFYDKYKCDDVRDTLHRMYNGLCCYCEAEIAPVSHDHIEHRHPKRKYPQRAFHWENLHLACSVCNTAKGELFDTRNPILDAVTDKPISKHLTYKVDKYGAWRLPLTPRGEITRKHADLNREPLRVGRRKIWDDAVNVITEINKDPNDFAAGVALEQLEAMSKCQYGSLVCFAKTNLLKSVDEKKVDRKAKS